MRGREWTERELKLLDTRYGTLGPERLAQMLDRSYHSVYHKAKRRHLYIGQLRGWTPASEVDAMAGLHAGGALTAARSAGVKIRRAAGRAILPSEWAEQFILEMKAAQEADELLDHGFYDTHKAAQVLDVSPATVKNWCRGLTQYSESFFSRVRFFRASGRKGNTYVFNPHDIEQVAKERRDADRSKP